MRIRWWVAWKLTRWLMMWGTLIDGLVGILLMGTWATCFGFSLALKSLRYQDKWLGFDGD